MSTIATLQAVLSSNASGFVQGISASRAAAKQLATEAREVQSVFNSTRTAEEQQSAELEKLSALYRKGAIDADTYGRAVKKAGAEAAEAHGPGALSQIGAALPGGGFLGGLAEGGGIGLALAGIEGLKSAISSGAEAAINAAKAVADLVRSQGEAILTTDQMSKTLGISVEDLSRLEYGCRVTRVSTEALSAGLRIMERNLTEISQGQGRQVADIIKSLGLDAAKLAAEDPAKAFRDIAAALADVQGGARVGDAMEVFGRGGAELLPYIQRGVAGMRELGEEAEKTGNAISGIDADQVRAAGESLDRVQGVIEGIGKQLAIDVSPYIEKVADNLFAIGTAGTGAADNVTTGFNEGVVALADFADWIMSGVRAFEQLNSAADQVILKTAQITGDTDTIKAATADAAASDAWIAAYDKATAAGETWHNSAVKMIDDVAAKRNAAAADAAFWNDSGSSGGSFGDADSGSSGGSFGDTSPPVDTKKLQQQADKITKLLDDLLKRRAQFGMSDAAKILDNLHAENASPAQLAQADDAQSAIDKMEAHKKAMEAIHRILEQTAALNLGPIQKGLAQADLANPAISEKDRATLEAALKQQEAAKEQQRQWEETQKAQDKTADDAQAVWEKMRTPAEKYNAEMERLKKLHESIDEGLPALDDESYDRAVKAAKGDYDKATGADREAPAIERRFSFLVTKPVPSDDDPKIAEKAKAHADAIAASGWGRDVQKFLQKISDTPDTIATFG
jgi:hypothetical protein